MGEFDSLNGTTAHDTPAPARHRRGGGGSSAIGDVACTSPSHRRASAAAGGSGGGGGTSEMCHPCLEGYTGNMCSLCVEGYFRAVEQCLKCPSPEGVTWIDWVMTIGLIGLVIIVWLAMNKISAGKYEALELTLLYLQCLVRLSGRPQSRGRTPESFNTCNLWYSAELEGAACFVRRQSHLQRPRKGGEGDCLWVPTARAATRCS
jgi:hypothetical protein